AERPPPRTSVTGTGCSLSSEDVNTRQGGGLLQRLVRSRTSYSHVSLFTIGRGSIATNRCPQGLVSSFHLKVTRREVPSARLLLLRPEVFPDSKGLTGPGSRPDHSKCAPRPSCRPGTESRSRSRFQPAY